MTNRGFIKGFGRFLTEAGFRKDHEKVWTRDREDVLEVVELQKSQYGDSFYVNIGVILRAIWKPETKIVVRLSHLTARPDLTEIDEVTDMLKEPRDLTDEDIRTLKRDLVPRIEAFFERFDSAEKLRAYALSVENVVPIPRRELRDWAGFDYSVWNKK